MTRTFDQWSGIAVGVCVVVAGSRIGGPAAVDPYQAGNTGTLRGSIGSSAYNPYETAPPGAVVSNYSAGQQQPYSHYDDSRLAESSNSPSSTMARGLLFLISFF